jgi:hypothetical protein
VQRNATAGVPYRVARDVFIGYYGCFLDAYRGI